MFPGGKDSKEDNSLANGNEAEVIWDPGEL